MREEEGRADMMENNIDTPYAVSVAKEQSKYPNMQNSNSPKSYALSSFTRPGTDFQWYTESTCGLCIRLSYIV